MSKLNMLDARCTALFASGLQRSDVLPAGALPGDVLPRNGVTGDAVAADVVAEAVRLAVRQFGVRGCAARMAQEFGDHPEAAIERMRWIRQLVGELPARSACPPAGCARHAA